MDRHEHEIENHPGRVLRELRTSREMTMQDLSEASGISVSMISKVETGSGDPSLGALRDLANALKVPLSLFFRDEPTINKSSVRVNHKQAYEFDGVRTVLMVPPKNSSTRLLQLFAQPGAQRSRTEFWTTTASLDVGLDYEYGLVISGEMELEIAGELYQLKAGDSIAFPTELPRSWRNSGSTDLHAIWCVTRLGAS